MKMFFLFFFAALQANDPLLELFPQYNEMKVGLIQNGRIALEAYDLLTADDTLTDVSSLERPIHWSANGYLPCTKECLTPLLSILMTYGKKGYTTVDDQGTQVVIWKPFPDPKERLSGVELDISLPYDHLLELYSQNSLSPFPQRISNSDKVSVAIYAARTADAFQLANNSLLFSPDSFYVEEIKRIYSLFDNRPLQITVFTEGGNTKAFIQKLEKLVKKPTINFFPAKDQSLDAMLQIIPQCDCFIHSKNHLGLLLSLMGTYRIEVAPQHAYKANNAMVIDAIELYFHP